MKSEPHPASNSDLESFLEKPTDDLGRWQEIWEGDYAFPIRTHRPGLPGRLVVALKRVARLFRPLVSVPQADLWERQRVFNRVLISHLAGLGNSLAALSEDVDSLGKDLQQVQEEILRDMREIQRDINGNVRGLSEDLDDFRRKGLFDVMRHTDALFSRLDQRMDRLRRATDEIARRAGLGDGRPVE